MPGGPKDGVLLSFPDAVIKKYLDETNVREKAFILAHIVTGRSRQELGAAGCVTHTIKKLGGTGVPVIVPHSLSPFYPTQRMPWPTIKMSLPTSIDIRE